MPKLRRSDQSSHQLPTDNLPADKQVSEISTLRRKRGKVIGQITAFTKFLDGSPEDGQRDIFLVEAHLTGLNEYWKRFDDIQSDIEDLDEGEETRRFEIQNDYYAVVARANRLIQGERPAASSTRDTNASPALSVSTPTPVKLPDLNLPTFDGTIEKWTSFYDIFSSSIGRNDDLTPVQKLQYLRSVLTGKAAASIECLSTTDANYISAIDLLKEKFDCTRRIILRHCETIREFQKPVKDSPETLGNLVDTVNQNLRALKNLGEPIESWNAMLVSIILSKVNADTVWHWEITLKDKKMPSYLKLLEFLEKRANCAPTPPSKSGSSENHRSNRQGPSRKQSVNTTTSYQCPLCKGPHGVWNCSTFKAQTVQERQATVEKASLCPNCLQKWHAIKFCKFSPCRMCHKRHHAMLHKSGRIQNETNDSSSTSGAIIESGTSAEENPTTSN